MEESIFENICKHSKRNLMELHKKTWTGRYVLSIMGIMYLTAILYGYIVTKDMFFVSVFLIVAGLMIVVLAAYPKKIVKLTLKRQKEMYGTEEIETGIKFFDDRIFGFNKQSKGENNMQYERIKKVFETKHLYILCFSNKIAILVDKNGFTKGKKENFIAFLKSKAPKAKFKVKA